MSYVGAGKDQQIRACLQRAVEGPRTNGFEGFGLVGRLPEFDFKEIDTSCTLLGKRLTVPLYIASLTGGGRISGRINSVLAEAAQELGIGMALGSQKLMLTHPETAESFQVRKWAPDILLMGNLGLVHLNYGLTVDDCRRAVESVEADALTFYLNPLHEIFQNAGDTNFRGILGKLEEICNRLSCPVVVKEVGFGLSRGILQRLGDTGVTAVDVAGQGGTDWGLVEQALGCTRPDPVYAELGIPTAEAVRAATKALSIDMTILASGGIRNGVEIAKAIALGATAAGMALPYLRWASDSTERVVAETHRIADQLRVSMWYAGAASPDDLRGRAEQRGSPPDTNQRTETT
ncbi:MAG: type 2 isopentenyl-diphosphate Delta-isomerase [Deferrisomatales bacterium]|nr:type 2 isopentenyl-diphosphate Delta-isomerase [Deferrisomatales bacterium]